MGADRLRVLGVAMASLVLLVAATLVLDWFTVSISSVGSVGIDLRTAHGCDLTGTICDSDSLSNMKGTYPLVAKATFFIGLAFGIAVAITAGQRIFTDARGPSIFSKSAYTLGSIALASSIFAGFVTGPSVAGTGEHMLEGLGVTITIDRTVAPFAMIGAVLAGCLAVYFALVDDAAVAVAAPVVLAPARVVTPGAETAPAVAPTAPIRRDATPLPTIPPPLRGKVRYAVTHAEISRAGIDARREDNTTALVMWRDVIGAVARRLPKELDGVTFVDVVSTAGATIRLLPWTKLSLDEPVDDQTDARRALALLAVITERCPDITLDPATRAFIEKRGEAAQLPDVATLAAHDERLA